MMRLPNEARRTSERRFPSQKETRAGSVKLPILVGYQLRTRCGQTTIGLGKKQTISKKEPAASKGCQLFVVIRSVIYIAFNAA
ncbi:MAG: hypothetical protein CEE38_17645 [Planctomycetes bacterium B3_Pla]|nr:MAG: hypothetical protein CEE38_17645 [Planctomycetes bacterium B3_Pla]